MDNNTIKTISNNIKKTFPENYRSFLDYKKLHRIKGDSDNYWIIADEDKDNMFFVMIGDKYPDVGGCGMSMNTFFTETLSKTELLEIDFNKIILNHKNKINSIISNRKKQYNNIH